MLHKDPRIIAPGTFKLIQELQAISKLRDFFLVGGTSRALQLGHRNSIDIDLFTQNEFEAEQIERWLKSKFNLAITRARKNLLLAVVNNIKTDFIRHDYKILFPPQTEEGIRFFGLEDITAMKLHAIVQSGKRLKDFINVYFLMEHFSLSQMLEFYAAKYPHSNPMIAIKAVNYFDDIDENIDPPKLLKPLPLTKIIARIQLATQKPAKIFKPEA
ncbi:MAG TPA: hypothetical protein PKI85_03185 [Chitinophagaceae bacterium]|nr:hypothetical protein [Chitinophagaceae bacterium]HNJ24844.1 hypothetical protein [Chitinophagaceae bacterium]HNJ55177.1 hypothetical protein [Chitinophagaceae bacterium]HNK59991.1 hypothetical protein [Chitinophagaceae bacterium]HNO00292.1 hypothetical protein [Chitinophagaceae bacterium]